MWLEPFRRFWLQRLDALATELQRGRREHPEDTAGTPPAAEPPITPSEDET
jgi:hypothetical protein